MVICDNNPAEVGAIIGKGVIWLIALVCLVISGISTGRAATLLRTARSGNNQSYVGCPIWHLADIQP